MAIANAGTNKYGTTRPSDNINPNDVLRDFLDAMAAAGIPAPDDLKTDTAEIQRFYIDGGKRNNKDGAYILHTDFPPNGGFQNHRGGEWIPYSYDWRKAGELGKQWYAYSRTEEGQAEIAAKEKERKEAAARAKAERRNALKARFEDAKAPDPAFGYLISKKIEGERAETYGVKQGVNDYGYQVLMVPYHNIDGEFMTYQEISANGEYKPFKRDVNVDGGFFAFGGVDALKAAPKDAPIYIGEGFATVASVAGANEATGKTLNKNFSAVSAGDAGKLKRCAEAIRAACPERPIIFLADDDIKTKGNPGLTKANEAAAAVQSMDGTGAIVVVKPPFDRNAPAQAELSDWNDFYTLHIDAGGDSASFKLALINAVTKANADAITEAEHAAAAEYAASDEYKAKLAAEEAEAEKAANVKRRMRFHNETGRPRSIPSYLVDERIKDVCLFSFFGAPGGGKSFVVEDMFAHVATSKLDTWHGIPISHGAVYYLAGEAVDEIDKRLDTWRRVHNVQPDECDFGIMEGSAYGFETEAGLAETIRLIDDAIAEGYPKPVAVIVDTLSNFFDGNQDRAEEMQKLTRNGKAVCLRYECAVGFVHHTGVSSEAQNRGRGSSVLRGDLDFEYKVGINTANKQEPLITLEQVKHKGGATVDTMEFRGVVTDCAPDWVTDKGRQLTTLVLELANIVTAEINNELDDSKESNVRIKYEGLFTYVRTACERGSLNENGTFDSITRGVWRAGHKEIIERYRPPKEKKEEETEQKNFSKGASELSKDNLIKSSNNSGKKANDNDVISLCGESALLLEWFITQKLREQPTEKSI